SPPGASLCRLARRLLLPGVRRGHGQGDRHGPGGGAARRCRLAGGHAAGLRRIQPARAGVLRADLRRRRRRTGRGDRPGRLRRALQRRRSADGARPVGFRGGPAPLRSPHSTCRATRRTPMSTTHRFGWTVHGDGKTIRPGTVVAPDERLNWFQTTGIGLQHVMAMFGSTVLVPALTGFPVTATLFFSGVGTLLFLVITAGRVPSYLGSSFAFIAPVTAAMAGHGFAGALGGIVMSGAALFVVGLVVQKSGTGWIHALMPPVAMGTIVALIGLNLAGATTEAMQTVPVTTFATVAAIVFSAVLFRGLLGRLSILVGIIVGYLVALAQQQVDFARVGEAGWVGLPPFALPQFHLDTLALFLPVVFV